MHNTLEIHVLLGGPCGENKVCPAVCEVAGRPGCLYVVSKKCTEPGEAAAFSHVLRLGEVIGWMPDGFLPVDSDLLTRTRGVTRPGVQPGRQYVISSEIINRDDLTEFAHLFDEESEHLGTALAPDRQLEGV